MTIETLMDEKQSTLLSGYKDNKLYSIKVEKKAQSLKLLKQIKPILLIQILGNICMNT